MIRVTRILGWMKNKTLSGIGLELVSLGEKFRNFEPKSKYEYDFIKRLNSGYKREEEIESWFPDAGALIYEAFLVYNFKLEGRLTSMIGDKVNKYSDHYVRNKELFKTIRDEWVRYSDRKFDYQWRSKQIGTQEASAEAMIYIGKYFLSIESV
ncbi:MAG: hypothetical protein RIE52_03920 [Balneola sp.]|jgi:hypothetical protein